MKKPLLFFVGVLFLGIAGIYAQDQDSTAVRDQSEQLQSVVASSASTAPSSNYVSNMVRIESTDIPARMRSALQGFKYKGWQNATFYRSKTYDSYVMEMSDGSNFKTYHFDAGGKPIQDE